MEFNEQETNINFLRTENDAYVYTTDKKTMKKLDKLCKNNPDEFKVVRVDHCEGKEIAKKYVFPKKYISFRSKTTKRELTEEQKKLYAERMRNISKKNK